MPKLIGKTKIPNCCPTFNTATDTPLRYFLVNDAFVRSTNIGNYKLFCGEYHVLTLDRKGWLYLYPTCTKRNTQHVEAFLHDYAPNIDISSLTPYFGKLHWVYAGNPQFITL